MLFQDVGREYPISGVHIPNQIPISASAKSFTLGKDDKSIESMSAACARPFSASLERLYSGRIDFKFGMQIGPCALRPSLMWRTSPLR